MEFTLFGQIFQTEIISLILSIIIAFSTIILAIVGNRIRIKLNKSNHDFEIKLSEINTKLRIFESKKILLQEKQLETIYGFWNKLNIIKNTLDSILLSNIKYLNNYESFDSLILEIIYDIPKDVSEYIRKSSYPRNIFIHYLTTKKVNTALKLSNEMYDYLILNLFYVPKDLRPLFFNLAEKYKSILWKINTEILNNIDKLNSEAYHLEFENQKNEFFSICIPLINEIETKIGNDYDSDNLLRN